MNNPNDLAEAMPNKRPKKLCDDAILEALLEIQFESNEIPEIIIGQLSECWDSFDKKRLSPSDIPSPIRLRDSRLKHAAVLEMTSEDDTHRIKIGSHVISCHIVKQYCGWDSFRPKLMNLINCLFSKCPNAEINRLGFRYLNAFTRDKHLINSINDLDIDIHVAGQPITSPFNLNICVTEDDTHISMARIASPELVQGNLPEETSVVADIDVYTPREFQCSEKNQIIDWIDNAHKYEHNAFFKLIPTDILNKIVEEWE